MPGDNRLPWSFDVDLSRNLGKSLDSGLYIYRCNENKYYKLQKLCHKKHYYLQLSFTSKTYRLMYPCRLHQFAKAKVEKS